MNSLRCATRTHPGLHRGNNEDNFAVSRGGENNFWAIVCDGMGGHASGEVASRIATETWTGEIACGGNAALDADHVSKLLALANNRIFANAGEVPRLQAMGTTAAVFLASVATSRFITAHVGDTRIYRFRGNRLDAITRDHNIAREVADEGSTALAEALNPAIARQLTRHLGMEKFPGPEIGGGEMETGDLYLICTDGLYSAIDESGMKENLVGNDLESIADRLIAATLKAGAPDNVTFVLVRCVGSVHG